MKQHARRKLNIDLYKKVYRVRAAERAITKYYPEDGMKTPMHMSMGEEAITAGVAMALGKRNQAFGYYRSHALYISKTDETDGFFAEMYGKATGTVGGKGGSMHLAAPEHGLMGISAVVASTIAPAVGAAFANKMKKNGKVVASFFGDGAVEEGVAWESLNVACLMKLPVIFVCEDNGLAVDVTARERQGFKSIPEVVKAYRCLLLQSDSTDPEVIYGLTVRAMDYIKKTGGPVFMHLKYYRLLQHIGINNDFDKNQAVPKGGFERAGYRSKKEYDRGLKNDPVVIARAKLISLGMKEQEIQKIETAIGRQVEQSVTLAKNAPFPGKEELHDHVYA
jgi:TPP-dependent pyruvate/acetoin dehydrogenase alpha subunit